MSETSEYPEEDIEEGVKYLESPITGTMYKVTKWVELGDGKFVAIEKEPADMTKL